MATYRLELDKHGEPVLVEECNGTTRPSTSIGEWVERYLAGPDDAFGQALNRLNTEPS